MKKIPMATLIVLVASTPLAFAGLNGSNSEPDSRHCTYISEKYDLCHTDRHKHGGGQVLVPRFRHRQ